MNKQEAIKKLEKHGIELFCVTNKEYSFYQQDLARYHYDVPEDCVVPTKEQYNRITNIIGEAGFRAIIEEQRKTFDFFIWSSSGTKCAFDNDVLGVQLNEICSGFDYFQSRFKKSWNYFSFWRFRNTGFSTRVRNIIKELEDLIK